MKNLFATLVCLVVVSCYALAGVKLEYIQYENGDKDEAKSSYMILSNDKIRLDDNTDEGKKTVIFDTSKQKLVVIDHDKESYMVIDQTTFANMKKQIESMKEGLKQQLANLPEAQRKQMEKMMGIGDVALNYSADKTGETKEINGWNTNKYTLKLNGESLSEVWATPVDNLGFTVDDFSVMKKFGKFFSELAKTLPMKNKNSMSAIVENIDGIPIMTKNIETDEVTELQKASKYTPTSADFDIPNNYTEQKIQMPGMDR
jgi:hypothetical protein